MRAYDIGSVSCYDVRRSGCGCMVIIGCGATVRLALTVDEAQALAALLVQAAAHVAGPEQGDPAGTGVPR